MKVGLNATCFNDRPSGAKQRFLGIGRELIRRLPDVEFVIYEPVDCRVGSWFDGAPNVFVRQTSLPSDGRIRKLFSGFRYWQGALSPEEFDFFEGFNLPLVRSPNGRTLLTIHDIRMVHPEWHGMARHAYKTVLEWSLKSADHVITVSESMKNEINHFYPHVPISVIFNGFDIDETNSISDLDLLAIRRKFLLPLEFILAVGHLESRKNYLRLVDAIALLRNRGHPCSLIVVGNDSGLGRAIQKRVESANLSCCVKLLSGLSDFEVRCVYKLSSMFVFPSSYEGFGIPILEAMAGNCPMVLSDIPVFREITQDQGVYFPPNDVELMAYAIEKVLYSSSEQQRLVEYGNQRVKDFNFQSLAIQMEGVYRSLL